MHKQMCIVLVRSQNDTRLYYRAHKFSTQFVEPWITVIENVINYGDNVGVWDITCIFNKERVGSKIRFVI